MAKVLLFVILLNLLQFNFGDQSTKVETKNTDDVIDQLLFRVNALEKKDHELITTIAKQQKQLNQQAMTLQQQQSQLHKQTAMLADQSALLALNNVKEANQDDRIAKLEAQLDTQRKETKQMLKPPLSNHNGTIPTRDHQVHTDESNNAMDTTNISHQLPAHTKHEESPRSPKTKRLVLDGNEGPVAFQARIDGREIAHLGLNQKLVFDVVSTNAGNAYHPQHGLFIAPQAGIYIFSTSVLSYVNDHSEFTVAIMMNGKAIARAYGHGDSGRHDQGSVTIVSQLNIGDEVSVAFEGPADDSLWGGGYTTFMGCLVMPA